LGEENELIKRGAFGKKHPLKTPENLMTKTAVFGKQKI
jgi:hypothetical protein